LRNQTQEEIDETEPEIIEPEMIDEEIAE